MKDRFLRIRGLGVVSDSWLVNNRGDQVHAQLSGNLNKKMVQDLTTRILQLFGLQGGYVGADTEHLCLTCDDHTIFAFDLGPLVLIAVTQTMPEFDRVLGELNAIADEFRADTRTLAKYEKKGLERREMLADGLLDEKARGLMSELKRSVM